MIVVAKRRITFCGNTFDDVYHRNIDPGYIKNMEKMLRYYIADMKKFNETHHTQALRVNGR